jgi:hypothetical protein
MWKGIEILSCVLVGYQLGLKISFQSWSYRFYQSCQGLLQCGSDFLSSIFGKKEALKLVSFATTCQGSVEFVLKSYLQRTCLQVTISRHTWKISAIYVGKLRCCWRFSGLFPRFLPIIPLLSPNFALGASIGPLIFTSAFNLTASLIWLLKMTQQNSCSPCLFPGSCAKCLQRCYCFHMTRVGITIIRTWWISTRPKWL